MQRIADRLKILPGIPGFIQTLFFVVVLLYLGKGLFIPMFFGLFIAMVMYPVCKWLEQRHISKTVAITISLTIVGLLFAALVVLLGWQLTLFREDIPSLVEKIKPVMLQLRDWISNRFGITIAMQDEWLKKTLMSGSGNIGHWIQATFSTTATTLFSLFLIPIY